MIELFAAGGIIASCASAVAAAYSFFWSGQAFSCPTHLGIKPWHSVTLPARSLNREAAPLFFEAWLKYRASLRRAFAGGIMSVLLLWWWVEIPQAAVRMGIPLTIVVTLNLLAEAHTISILRRSPVERAFLQRARAEFDRVVAAQ